MTETTPEAWHNQVYLQHTTQLHCPIVLTHALRDAEGGGYAIDSAAWFAWLIV